MKRLLALVLLVLALGSTAQAAPERVSHRQLADARGDVWRCQDARSVLRSRASRSVASLRRAGPAYRVWVYRRWRSRARACESARKAENRSLIGDRNAWLCIYRHEKGRAGWQTNTGNGYYGGLQMDLGFQRTYGPELLRTKGTADRWSPTEQMMVAERARRSGRGYWPWPNTARYCGLLS